MNIARDLFSICTFITHQIHFERRFYIQGYNIGSILPWTCRFRTRALWIG